MKNIGKLLKEAQKMQEKMAKVQEDLASKKVEATSGGGMVKVEMNGAQELLSIKIDKEVVNPDDIEMLETLIQAAVNEATRKSKEMVQEELSQVTGGMNIPGLI
ncbi:MAG: YbaB/EbfC family nucleoid-associated protein [Candidatus Omnitrophica bacterium]|nr:YbaB/EbfC family nucleoid-associated protein [Candidatus Omnitrophota bacterium]MBU1048334.1 YbaB/EbfC family nucleoid-associated protein [Candidatus Omnitrophota bacterium]MBU1630903.1 YbaB/EbfC family nucleoid-associated protein [Candidatus Omnitrophota bacterium]MBU1889684.1 YbaB/EbfC family nucleoid-associated protein [Candidatus Omnitrophota bacterium]